MSATGEGAVSAEPTDALVILVAPAGILAGIRDVLQDWVALGFARSYCWVEDPPPPETSTVYALETGPLGSAPVRLAELLAGRDHQRIRLCVLVPVFVGEGHVPELVEDQLAALVRSNSGFAQVELLRCLVTRPDCGPGEAAAAREGWHNVVLSPEDARGPGSGFHRLEPSVDPVELGPAAAAALAGLTGLWAGIDEAPLDARSAPIQDHLRLCRSFFRRLDAEAAAVTVRNGVLSTRGELPRPRAGSGQAVIVEDIGLATSDMADQFWTKHADILRGPRATLPQSEQQKIGALAAIKMLAGYLIRAIWRAPMAWYAGMVHGISSRVAAAVQSAVFTQTPSAYQVVVRGVRADGRPADWQDMVRASGQLSELTALSGGRPTHGTTVDNSRMWKDFVAAGCTLADAGDRSIGLLPISVGGGSGIVACAANCVPGADDWYTDLPADVAAPLGRDALDPVDVLGVRTAQQRLRKLADEGDSSLSAERTVGAIDRWSSRHRNSFAVRVATRLGDGVVDLNQEIRNLLRSLADAGEAGQPSEELRRQQRSLAALMRGLLIGAVVLCGTLLALGGFNILSWAYAGIGCAVVVVLWTITSLITFMRCQRQLFAEMHRRRTAVEQSEILRQNLGQAVLDLRRAASAYGQLLLWARALRVLLAAPFGEPAVAAVADSPTERDLPLGMRLGYADPEPSTTAEVVAQLRRGVFRSGWLTGPWEALVAEAPDLLGPDALDLRESPERLYAERADSTGLLNRWVELIEKAGVSQSVGDRAWAQVVGSPAGIRQTHPLLERVRVVSSGQVQSRQAFMNAVDDSDSARGLDDVFDSYLLSPSARSQQANAVAENWRREAQDGLSRVAVMVQLSGAQRAFDFEHLQPDDGPPIGWDFDNFPTF